jgi:hypothetical protein
VCVADAAMRWRHWGRSIMTAALLLDLALIGCQPAGAGSEGVQTRTPLRRGRRPSRALPPSSHHLAHLAFSQHWPRLDLRGGGTDGGGGDTGAMKGSERDREEGEREGGGWGPGGVFQLDVAAATRQARSLDRLLLVLDGVRGGAKQRGRDRGRGERGREGERDEQTEGGRTEGEGEPAPTRFWIVFVARE